MRKSVLSCLALLLVAIPAGRADESLAAVVDGVNKKLVKVFGAGGFRGLAAYGTGVVISGDGYALTAASHLLDTGDLRVHLSDGRRYPAKTVVVEPELDVALIKIDVGPMVTDLPHFDVLEAGKKPLAEPGTGVLGFSNQFEIATRDEPMSVQRGVIAAYGKLHGRKGVHDATYRGDVYVVDAITNNPGAAGGALTTRRGELVGLIGKELKNALTDTWINYAVPLQAKVEVQTESAGKVTVALLDLVEKKEKYRPVEKKKGPDGPGGYHGIVLVPNVVDRTPPYVEDVVPGSPAAQAGLKADDLIVYVDGEQVVSIEAFRKLIDRVRPGTKVRLEVRRGDRLTGVDVTLIEPPSRGQAKKP